MLAMYTEKKQLPGKIGQHFPLFREERKGEWEKGTTTGGDAHSCLASPATHRFVKPGVSSQQKTQRERWTT